MSSLRLVRSCSLLALAWFTACGDGPPPAPDAPPSMIPTSPAGIFTLTSTLDIEVPPAAAPVLARLIAATDGPDDPSRYLLDRMIATLPDGPIRTLAGNAAPYLAAYLNERLGEIAPGFVTGIDKLADGLSRIASHIGTVETLQIDATGAATRTITAVRFELGAAPITLRLADNGLGDIVTSLDVTLDTAGAAGPAGTIALGTHAHALPYGAVLRLGLDRAVVGSVVPAAHDLAGALTALVDCDRLGTMVADRIGLGSEAPYRAACRAGMIAIASEVYDRIATIDDTPLGLELAGTALGIDLDANGTMDELRQGRWTGTVTSGSSRAAIQAASFTGKSSR